MSDTFQYLANINQITNYIPKNQKMQKIGYFLYDLIIEFKKLAKILLT
jgi:hypothetical protein